MSEFLSVLALYYVCDATAALRPMSAEEIGACFSTYDTVKVYFVDGFDLAPPGSMARIRQMSEAYLAFKAWEEDNAALVADMRADARELARLAGPALVAGAIDG